MDRQTLLDVEFPVGFLPDIKLSDSWGITNVKSDDVIWSIVWAYLNSFSVSNENELTKRIKCLIGCQKEDEKIKHSIEECNPFLHRTACFCNEVISELVIKFKERVENYIKEDEKLLNMPANNFRYLEASSKLLSCNIVVIAYPGKNELRANIFPVQTNSNTREVYGRHILIVNEFILTVRNEVRQEKFFICISKEIGAPKQREALTEILKRTRITDNKKKIIQKVSCLQDITENFLLSLLKNGFGKIIPLVLESPYVISKLTDAGFLTDPRIKDSEGKSAFLHALKSEEFHLVSVLYDHAANACLQTDASVRSPDPLIVENLLCLKDFLKLLEKDLDSEDCSEKARSMFRDLYRFNKFQIEMCRNINNIKLMINYYEKEFEAMQRKDTILIILKTYKSYFDFQNRHLESSLEADDISHFKEFYKHKEYFDKLDFSTAVMFFDNLFLLKESVKLQDEAYLDIESKFFLFIFCRKYLEQYEKHKEFYFVSRWITFQERLSLHTQIYIFNEILEKTELSKENIVDIVPETAVRTLINLPEIYGQFLIFQLQHYLQAATGLTVKDSKSILVIERCLQVIGECLKESNFNSIQKILTLGLSSNFTSHLKQIRNRLAHIKHHEIPYRITLEQDTELFIGIKKELIELKKVLQPIYSIHKYQLDSFLLLHSVTAICKAGRKACSKIHENKMKAILSSLDMKENESSKSALDSHSQWKSYFDDMRTYLQKDIDNLNYNANILNRNTINYYKFIAQNMISAVRERSQLSETDHLEKNIENLDNHLWCLENFLIYMTKDKKLAQHRRSLKLILKDRKSLFTEIQKELREDVEDVIIEKHLTSKYNGTTNNIPQTMNGVDAFVKFGTLYKMEPNGTMFIKQDEENVSPLEGVEKFDKNMLKSEINMKKFEKEVSKNMHSCSITQKSASTEDSKEVTDLSENATSPKTINLFQENIPKTSGINSHDDWQLVNVFNICDEYSDNNKDSSPSDILNNERKQSKNSRYTDRIKKIIDDYGEIADLFFQEIPGKKIVDFRFNNIEKYCLILKGWIFLNKKEKEFIVQSVPKQYKNIPELKQKVKTLLRQEASFTSEIKAEVSKLNLKNREIKEIAENIKLQLIDEADRIIDSARDYFSDLKEMMESKEIDKSDCVVLCKNLEIPDDAKNILLKLVPGLKKKVSGNQFEFMRNRIKMLKKILIDDNDAIQQLWERANTSRRKMHVKEKIIQMYVNDSEIQASVETLLFDCMTILSSKELKHLWKKTSNLFNGVNLRNVLAHGHPLLESLGRLLDPYDLPSELVEKMMKLISDECVLDCMQQILEQSGTDFSGFMRIMNDDEDEQFKIMREQILKSDQWKDYAFLIPGC